MTYKLNYWYTYTCNIQLPLGKTFNLTSDKDEGVFGLRLAGGRNKTIGRGFIYIKSIIDGSIAAKSNSLRESDLLLEVGDHDL